MLKKQQVQGKKKRTWVAKLPQKKEKSKQHCVTRRRSFSVRPDHEFFFFCAIDFDIDLQLLDCGGFFLLLARAVVVISKSLNYNYQDSSQFSAQAKNYFAHLHLSVIESNKATGENRHFDIQTR